MDIITYLESKNIHYDLCEHDCKCFTAQQVAAAEHEPGKYVAKPVIIKAEDKFLMCILPACNKVDIDLLKKGLGSENLELATEQEMQSIFPDTELGAEPPFGNLYDLATIMDKSLEKDDHILFQAGTHSKAIKISMKDYMALVSPQILEFSYHL